MSKKIHISSFYIPCSILVLVKTGIRYWTLCKKYQKQLSAYLLSIQSIPQHTEVPPNIEAKRIISYFSAVLSY